MKNPVLASPTLSRSTLNVPALRLTPLAAALAAGLFVLPSAPASAATITVVNGGCTLIDAITAANSDTATGLCPAGSGADTIILPKGSTQTLTAVNNTTTMNGDNGLPVITSTLTVVGNGSTIVRDPAAADFRILMVSNSGNLSLQETTLSGGRALGGGSGTYGTYGGGIFSTGSLTLSGSTVSNNFATNSGGGIADIAGTVTLSNSTVSGNTTFNGGGGIFGRTDTVTLIDSTVTGNQTAFFGGGIFAYLGTTLNLSRSLISGNTENYGTEIYTYGGVTATANNFNLFGNSGNSGLFGFARGATDIVPAGALATIIGPLANNGGPTRTHALVTGGPAVDAAGATCSPTDQRGVNRPKGAACDIGAFEVGVNTADLAILKTASASSVVMGSNVTFTLTVANNGPENATDVQVFDTLPAQLSFVSATPTAGSCAFAAGTLSCEFSDAPVGGSAIISVVTTAITPGTASNTASIISAPIIDFDPDTANNASTATVLIQPPPDTTPNAFVFMDQTNVPRNSVRRSNTITITGLTAPAPISIMGGGYSIGCTGTFTATASTIANGQTVCVAHTSAATFNSGVNTVLTVGGVSDTFTSVTAPNAIAALLGVTFRVIGAAVGTVLGLLAGLVGG